MPEGELRGTTEVAFAFLKSGGGGYEPEDSTAVVVYYYYTHPVRYTRQR